MSGGPTKEPIPLRASSLAQSLMGISSIFAAVSFSFSETKDTESLDVAVCDVLACSSISVVEQRRNFPRHGMVQLDALCFVTYTSFLLCIDFEQLVVTSDSGPVSLCHVHTLVPNSMNH